MKQDELVKSIYGCLERIENKINGLSIPQSADGNSEVDNSANEVALQEVTQELNTLKTGFKRVFGALVMLIAYSIVVSVAFCLENQPDYDPTDKQKK